MRSSGRSHRIRTRSSRTSSSFARRRTRSTIRSSRRSWAGSLPAPRAKGCRRARTYLDDPAGALVSRDRHATIVPVALFGDDEVASVVGAVEAADEDEAFAVSITGEQSLDYDFNALSQEDLEKGELQFGLPAALIILLLVFGAVVAGLVPLLMAIVSIVVALRAHGAARAAFEISIFVVNMLTGMGLALGIDYSLFIVSRFREERGRGHDEQGAIGAAGATASRAVLFSGTAFVVAMFGMLLVPNSIMRSLAAGAILVGIVSVVAALTLLPAVLGLLGDRIDSLRIPVVGRRSGDPANPEGRFWGAVVRRVLRRPGLSLGLSVALLVALALPVLGLKIGTSGVTTLPDRFVSKQGFVALWSVTSGNDDRSGGVVVSGGASSPDGSAAARAVAHDARHRSRFGEERSSGRPTARWPRSRSRSEGTRQATSRDSRSGAPCRASSRRSSGDNAEVLVGGTSSEQIDYFDSVVDPTPVVHRVRSPADVRPADRRLQLGRRRRDSRRAEPAVGRRRVRAARPRLPARTSAPISSASSRPTRSRRGCRCSSSRCSSACPWTTRCSCSAGSRSGIDADA